MSNESNICPKCGGVVSAEAPQGLCPKCLLAAVSVPTAAGQPQGERPVPPSIDELSAAFPQLEILELIGQGGMGFVFKARQARLDRFVALKILPKSLALDPAFAGRFSREGRVLARLNHPNIVTVYDFGLAGDYFFLTMEYVDGVNLRQAMHAGRFTPAQALAVVPKICDALQFAHNEGILHRDIKPENILLDSKGRVKIADFGIAKLIGEPHDDAQLTASGASLGTPHYMAPEQIEKPGEVDHRADIYSLGVVFYEMLTGELPLGRFAPPSQKSTADPRLDELVFRTLDKEPANRPQSAGAVKTQVENISTTPRQKTDEDSTSGRRPRRSPPLKLSRCCISTPAHLRTLLGNIIVFTGQGELRLGEEALVYSDGGGIVNIPLRSVRNVVIGKFPLSATWRRIDYIAVTFQENAAIRTLLFAPYGGWFQFRWQMTQAIADWFDAIRDAVADAIGHEPGSVLPTELSGPFLPGWKGTFLLLAQSMVVTAVFSGLFVAPWFLMSGGGPLATEIHRRQGVGFLVAMVTGSLILTAWWRRHLTRRAADLTRSVAPQPGRFRGNNSAVIGAIILLLAPLLGVGLIWMFYQASKPRSPIPVAPPKAVDMKPGSRALYYKWLPINRDPTAGVTVTAEVDVALYPVERISAWQKTSDGPLEEATHIQTESRLPGGIEYHQSFSWTLPAWVSKGENWALQDRLQRTPAAPLMLTPEKLARLFSVTNSEGKVFEGNVLLERPRAEASTPDRPEAVVRCSDFSVVIVDPVTVASSRMSPAMRARYHLESAPSEVPNGNRLEVRASVDVPPDYTLETYFEWETNRFHEPSGKWMTESREIRSARTNFYQSTWFFPDSFSGNEVYSALAQSALVPLQTAVAATSISGGRTIKVIPIKPYQLFALTNYAGEVFRGGYMMVVPGIPRMKH